VKTFFDSSAFAKRFLEEPGSDAIEALCLGATDLGLCVICVPEILSALVRRLREKRITAANFALLERHLLDDIRDATIVNLTPEVVAESIRAIKATPIRAADALHVAAAKVWDADIFVSADQRQLTAARKVGLRVKGV